MSRMIITRPEHEPATRYLSCWSGYIIEAAIKKNIDVTDLRREKAVRKELEGRLLVILNGHGSDECVLGHNDKELINIKSNGDLLKGRVTYAVSCNSAKLLGKYCADTNTAYIGYNEKFVFNAEARHLSHPLEDKRAARFLQSSNQVSLSLIKGHTAKESSDNSKSLFRDQIRELLPSANNDPSAREDAADLFWDMNHQVCEGNGNLRI
jgi:hypothetical protein